jgi:hypothetical protein
LPRFGWIKQIMRKRMTKANHAHPVIDNYNRNEWTNNIEQQKEWKWTSSKW